MLDDSKAPRVRCAAPQRKALLDDAVTVSARRTLKTAGAAHFELAREGEVYGNMRDRR